VSALPEPANALRLITAMAIEAKAIWGDRQSLEIRSARRPTDAA
jgi:hypothetical protein